MKEETVSHPARTVRLMRGGSYKNLSAHMVVHGGFHLTGCVPCVLGFHSQNRLEKHLLSHFTFPCNMCEAVLNTEPQLWEHMRTHVERKFSLQPLKCGSKLEVCDECVAGFAHEKDLEAHLASNRPGDGKGEGGEGYNAAYIDEVRRAFGKPLGSLDMSPLPCKETADPDFPGRLFDPDFANEVGRIFLLPDNSKVSTLEEHVCLWCNHSFKDRVSLQDHLRIVHSFHGDLPRVEESGSSDRCSPPRMNSTESSPECETDSFPCHVCNRIFRSRPGLRYHLQKVHLLDICRLKCHICHRRFNKKSLFQEHLADHGLDSQRQYQKSADGFVSNLEESKVEHARLIRSGNDSNGNIMKFTKESLNSPSKTCPSGGKFGCHLCGKRFHRVDIADKHLRLHAWQADTASRVGEDVMEEGSGDDHLLDKEGAGLPPTVKHVDGLPMTIKSRSESQSGRSVMKLSQNQSTPSFSVPKNQGNETGPPGQRLEDGLVDGLVDDGCESSDDETVIMTETVKDNNTLSENGRPEETQKNKLQEACPQLDSQNEEKSTSPFHEDASSHRVNDREDEANVSDDQITENQNNTEVDGPFGKHKKVRMEQAMLRAYQDLFGPSADVTVSSVNSKVCDPEDREGSSGRQSPLHGELSDNSCASDSSFPRESQGGGDLPHGSETTSNDPSENRVANTSLAKEDLLDKGAANTVPPNSYQPTKKYVDKMKNCNVCHRGFYKANHLQRHLKEHKREPSSDRPSIHQGDNVDVDAAQNVESVRDNHEKTTMQSCPICHRQFKQVEVLNRHMIVHQGSKFDIGAYLSKPPQRERTTEENHSRKPPQRETVAEVNDLSKPPQRERIYEVNDLSKPLQQETMTEANDVSKPPQQETKASDKSGEKSQVYSCKYCLKSFMMESSRQKHQRIHEYNPRKDKHKRSSKHKYPCSICGKRFTSPFNVKAHENRHGTLRNLGTMTEGNDLSKPPQQETMTEGNDRSGKESQVYSCKYCMKSFMLESSRKKHQRIHDYNPRKDKRKRSSKYKYPCSICGKRFTSPFHVKTHENRHGTLRITAPDVSEKGLDQGSPGKVAGNGRRLRRRSYWRPPVENGEGLSKGVGETGSEDPACASKKKASYSCTVCGTAFWYKSIWLRHMKKHASIERKEDSSSTPTQMQGHADSKEKTKELFSCLFCRKLFRYVCNLERHVNYHMASPDRKKINRKIFGCAVCGKRFLSALALKNHVKKHREKTCHSCSVCDKVFSYELSLKKHMATHEKIRQKSEHACSLCGKIFVHRRNLKKHMVLHKATQKFSHKKVSRRNTKPETSDLGPPMPFTCSVCGKSFQYESYLLRHKISHSSRPGKTVSERFKKRNTCVNELTCRLCGKLFLYKWNRLRHELKTHSNDHQVVIGGKSSKFETVQTWRPREKVDEASDHGSDEKSRASKSHHSTPASNKRVSRIIHHVCQYCDMIFYKKSRYIRHVKQHTGKNRHPLHSPTLSGRAKWVCQICDQPFYSKATLGQHMLFYHGTKDNTKCETPNEGKTQKVQPGTVSQIKCGYFCGVCDERFYEIELLKEHLKTHEADPSQLEAQYLTSSMKSTSQKTANILDNSRLPVCEEDRSRSRTTTVKDRAKRRDDTKRENVKLRSEKEDGVRDVMWPTTNTSRAFEESATREQSKRQSLPIDDGGFFPCNLCENIYTSTVKLKLHCARHHLSPQ